MPFYAFILNGTSYVAVFHHIKQTIQYMDEFGEGGTFMCALGPVGSQKPLAALIQLELEHHLISTRKD